jgi:hypothetical protein
VDQLLSLLLNGGHNLGMTVTGRTDGDTGVAIEEDVAVNILNPNALRPLSDKFE